MAEIPEFYLLEFVSKMHQNHWRPGLCPWPPGETYTTLPRFL